MTRQKSFNDSVRKDTSTVSRTKSSDKVIVQNTGRDYAAWFKMLDRWEAKGKKHSEIAGWLSSEHEVDGWWAQHLTVAFEQERGMRAPGQMADGTYSVSASKTVGVPLKRLFEAFENEAIRSRWLGDFDLEVRTARPNKSVTARWEGGKTRLTVGFYAKDAKKSRVALAHEKIPDSKQADELKTFWKERLSHLKKLLEGLSIK
ncbi:MAG: hypothetical protein ACR2M4_00615 [Actinomycetota bacterium]